MSGLACEQARNLFDAHLDGELSGSLSTELAAHLLKCPTCRHELALMEVAGHVVRSETAGPRLSDEFTDRLVACIETPAPVPFYRRARVLISAASTLAAAACVVIAVTLVSEPEQRIKGVVVVRGGPVEAAESASLPDRPTVKLHDATDAVRRRIETSALETFGAANSLGEAGRSTLLETISVMQPRPVRAENETPSSPQGLPESHQPVDDGPEVDAEIEDL